MIKNFEKLYVVIIAVLTLTLTLSFIVLPDKSFSGAENRMLSSSPEFSGESLISGEFSQKAGPYIADQFPLRDGFIAAKAYTEILLGKKENGGVINAEGYLIAKPQQAQNRLSDNLTAINDFKNNTGATLTVAALPRSIDVFAEKLPDAYPTEGLYEIWQEYFSKTGELGLNAVDLYTPLCEQNLYYKTDHHYTTEGAYMAYCVLGESLGYSPYPAEYFTKQTVSNDFCGTSMRASGFYLSKRDSITLFRYGNDTEYTITADGKSISLYDFEALDKTDKYSVFLGGNHRRVDISSGKEKLLIIRDSFADSIAPFLALHYDLVMIDLRYFTDSVAALLRNENISKVLVFESISELSTAKNLTYLRMK